jgi:glycosyltransferase involved in cell wall biosynthesis
MAELTIGMANSIITISSYVRDSLPERLKKRASVILNPFDFQVPTRVAGRSAVEPLIGEGRSVIGFVGTLQRQKRPDVFLRAAAKIHARRPNTKFLVIGRDGGLEPEMRRLSAELGLANAVVFTGFRADAELLLAGCDMLLAPAVDEGYGRTLVEAMMCRVPVISSRSGGHIEVLGSGERGLLVPADDPEAFAAAAHSVLGQPAAGQVFADAGYEWARVTFSPERHAEAVAAEYRRVLLV